VGQARQAAADPRRVTAPERDGIHAGGRACAYVGKRSMRTGLDVRYALRGKLRAKCKVLATHNLMCETCTFHFHGRCPHSFLSHFQWNIGLLVPLICIMHIAVALSRDIILQCSSDTRPVCTLVSLENTWLLRQVEGTRETWAQRARVSKRL
jgi:hypothetical protein